VDLADETATPPKPIPTPDEGSRLFYEGTLLGELRMPRCRSCGQFLSPTAGAGTPVESVRKRCVRCLSDDLEWTTTEGAGTLYSFGIMHVVYHPAYADDVPYNIAVIELDEGVRITSQVVDCPLDELMIGMRVQVTFEFLGDDIVVPKFVRAGYDAT
jgi:uncharacterized OB-fold protein